MTSAQIVGLGIRLFAIWLVAYVLRNVPGMWQFNASGGAGSANVAVILIACLLLVIAAALWFFPLTAASKLIPASARTDHIQIPFEHAQSLGFSLLGLWMLTDAVPDAFYWLLMTYHASRLNSSLEFRPSDYSLMITTGLQVVLGVWLLFGAKRLLGLLRWARSAGT